MIKHHSNGKKTQNKDKKIIQRSQSILQWQRLRFQNKSMHNYKTKSLELPFIEILINALLRFLSKKVPSTVIDDLDEPTCIDALA